MLLDVIPVFLGNLVLKLLDPLVEELGDLTCLETDHVVMVRSIGKLEHRLTALEIEAADETCALELSENPVYGSEPELLTAIEQRAIDGLRGHMTLPTVLEDFEHLEARRRDLETRLTEILTFHVTLARELIGYDADPNYDPMRRRLPA
jgi:hypothetical protein